MRADEHGFVHDAIRAGQIADHPERRWIVLLQLHERWLAQEVSAEEHPVADLRCVECLGKLAAGELAVGPHYHHEAEPRAIGAVPGSVSRKSAALAPAGGMRGQHKAEVFFQVGQSRAKRIPVIHARLDEGG